MSSTMKQHFRRLSRALLADRKKFTLMVMLIAVGLLLWGRILSKRVPRTAIADDKHAVAVSGSDGHGTGSDATRNGSGSSAADRTVYVDFEDALRRDLFVMNTHGYQKILSGVQSPKKLRYGLSDEQESPQRDQATLRLQSTILGHRPRAFINGWLLKPEQSIDGYTLKEVGHRQVTLEKNGSEFVLKMRIPPPGQTGTEN